MENLTRHTSGRVFFFVMLEVWLRLGRLLVNALAALVSFDVSWRSASVCCFRLSAEVEGFEAGITFECPPCSMRLYGLHCLQGE